MSSSGKQLVRGKSGMRMIAVSENERSPFLLEEPHWTDDAQVSCFVAFILLLLDNFIIVFAILQASAVGRIECPFCGVSIMA